MTSILQASLRGPVLELALNRPERRNALTRQLVLDLGRALREAQNDPAVRVVVLTGNGGSFCAGADLEAIRGVPAGEIEGRIREFHELILAITEMDQPVLAAVDGAAVGFGSDLALACDLRVLSDRAYFEESFSKIGLMPDGGGTYFLPRAVGARAFELIALGQRLDASSCQSLGLANRVVPSTELPSAVAELADRLANVAPLALAAVKGALRSGRQAELRLALAREAEGQARLLQSSDFQEGVAAFLEKRAPRFSGR
jgi:2-(1,2-epoxy-1,2-dihydrophenyl)acetyl-CoA isomerase